MQIVDPPDSAAIVCDSAPAPSLVLSTGSCEVGNIWVHQRRNDNGVMLGAIIENINYIGFQVVNDPDFIHAPDFRLYHVDEHDALLEKGQVWKIISGVEKRRRKSRLDTPVTTLYIRIVESDASDLADWIDDPTPLMPVCRYYVGRMKETVSLHPSGSGLMGDRSPSFSVFKREFVVCSEVPTSDVATSAAVAVVPDSGLLTDEIGTPNNDATSCNEDAVSLSHSYSRVLAEIAEEKTRTPELSDSVATADEKAAVACPLSDSPFDRIFAKSLTAARRHR